MYLLPWWMSQRFLYTNALGNPLQENEAEEWQTYNVLCVKIIRFTFSHFAIAITENVTKFSFCVTETVSSLTLIWRSLYPKKGIVSNESLARSDIQELAGVSVIHQSTITKLAVAINIKTLAWEKQASFSWWNCFKDSQAIKQTNAA